MGGEGDFVITDKFEMLDNKEIMYLFKKHRESDYRKLEKGLDGLEVKINSIKKGSRLKNIKTLNGQLNRYLKEFDDIKQIDFFPGKLRYDVEKKLDSLHKDFKKIIQADLKKGGAEQEISIPHKRKNNYQGKIWVTRKKPFVDRMASAWLIKKFVDSNAIFRFIDESKVGNMNKGSITFDIKGGEITHIGNLCTFEVFIKSFGIKDRAVKKIAELVHELDMKDDRYSSLEAKGIEEILLGIRKTSKGDLEALEKGMAVFEMFYASKT